jgi:ankyrin repeat protein
MTLRRWLLICCGLVGIWLIGCAKPQPPTNTEIQEFQTAVQDGDEDIVERLLRAKPLLVNVKNQEGMTPLKVAEQRGNQALVDVLKKHGGHE